MLYKTKYQHQTHHSSSGFRGRIRPFSGWGFLFFLFFSASVSGQTSLYENFKQPNEEASPWTFWYWMHGAVSKEGIKADLEAMKQIGLGGAYLMPIKGIEGSTYPIPVSQLTPEWWKMIKYSFQVADSLGLKMGMHISDGFALAGGPWIKPEESMQKIVFTDTIVKGGKWLNLQLRQPEMVQNYYEDIAVYALPMPKSISKAENNSTFKVFTTDGTELLPSHEGEGLGVRSEKPCHIDYTFEKPFTLRSIEITPAGNNIQSQRLTVSASEDGKKFRQIKQLQPPRQGWQNTGFSTTFSIPPTTAQYFRLSWTPKGTEPGSEELDAAKWKPILKIKSIQLSDEPRINGWEGKSGLVWRIGEATSSSETPDKECIPSNKIIILTSRFNNGILNCKLPKGEWRILRIGHTSTGMTNATGGGGKGLECDKFSEKTVQKQFDNWFGAVFTQTDSALAHRMLKYMHIDSWECGSQNWSNNFAQEFKNRRGYDLMPYLPLMAGYPIDNVQFSEKVLLDVRTTIAELVNDVFFQVMVKNAHQLGCEVSSESVAPTMVSDGLLHYKEVDRPMGEFWLRSPTHDKPNDMLDAISAGHIYGKNIIQSESFTQLRTNWDEDPALLKPVLDRNFALGINKIFFHIFVHNPYTDKAPGTTLDGIGLYFQRDQTWWKQGKSFVDYIARCQALLQYGQPVTDIAVFTGEEIPRRSLTPDKLVPVLPGIMGENRILSEKYRLANTGQPMIEMPAGVNHSANILKAEDWVNPLNGYAYDSFNKEVLLTAKAKNGKMKLESGAEYRTLIFPDFNKYSIETLDKIQELQNGGVAIPDLPFTDENFNRYNLEKDVIAPENIAWTHRSGQEAEIYFLSNQDETEREIEVSFRFSGRIPELWQPVNGDVSIAKNYTFQNGRTLVKVKLDSNGSVFVVFPVKNNVEKITETVSGNQTINPDLKWNITFERNNQQVETSELTSWSESENPLIKFYSGTAIYKSSFTLKEISGKFSLDLGKVYNLATVKINDIDCGTVWTAPYRVDISKALKKGTNTLEIEVTNTWANAINGWDKGTPPFEGIWTDGQYRMKGDKLLEAGLLGPVKLIAPNLSLLR